MWRLLITGLVLCAGCVPQSSPIHTSDQIVFERRLIGKWETVEGGSKLTFDIRQSPQGDKTYHVFVGDEAVDKSVSEFGVQLARIDGRYYATIANVDSKQNSGYSTVVVDQWEPKLKVRILNRAWFFEAIESEPAIIKHSRSEKKNFLVTATTEEILAFYQKHLEYEGPWETFVLARKQ